MPRHILLKYTRQLTIQSIDIFESNFAVSPDRGHDDEELVAAESPVRHAEVLTVHDKGQRALVHVQHNYKDR